MRKDITTEILINAPSEHVWKVLMDFASYPDWNPFIRSIKGDLHEGATLRVEIEPPKKKAMTFQPRVRVVKTNQELRWIGHTLVPGLFDGEHLFILEERDSETWFIQKERFRGILAGLFFRMIEPSTRNGFEEMNQALKERVEQVE